MNAKRIPLVVAVVVSLAALGVSAQSGDPQQAVDAAFAKYRTLKEGKNADYIPALAKVDPNLYGIALVTADGTLVLDEVQPEGKRPMAGAAWRAGLRGDARVGHP